jgi:hypothetical protein
MPEKAGFHDFQALGADRRQYPRLSLTFPMWWLTGELGGVEGIAVEISAGGIQFLLQRELSKRQCSIAFQINDRKMWAKISIVRTTQTMQENQPWNSYGASFEELLESDFDFIVVLSFADQKLHSEVELAGASDSPLRQESPTASTPSFFSLQSNAGILPDLAREQIVQMLVTMDRLQGGQCVLCAHCNTLYRVTSVGGSGCSLPSICRSFKEKYDRWQDCL